MGRKEEKISKMVDEKGITLIALVITIIVLLILAGVTIAMLTGENGILTQAQNAKEQNEIAEVKERVKLDIQSWIADKLEKGEDATVDADEKVKEILNEANPDSNNWYFKNLGDEGIETKSGYIIAYEEFYTKASGESSFDASSLTIGEAINEERYGYKVAEYTVEVHKQSMTSNVWRLFYQDENYTYIIIDGYGGGDAYMDQEYSNYADGSYVSTIGQKLNPMLLNRGTFFTSSNKNENIRATAWLTDVEVWKDCQNEDAVFAIGSPTIELIVASFNATASANGANRIELGVGDYGYTYTYPDGNVVFDKTYNNGIYSKNDASYWLASPYDEGKDDQCLVSVLWGLSRAQVMNDLLRGTTASRPIVCIPTSVFNEKYTLLDE